MGRWAVCCAVASLTLVAVAGGYFFLMPAGWRSKAATGTDGDPAPKGNTGHEAVAAQTSPAEIGDMLAPRKEKLPETEPPPDLPIVAWGTRDFFPMIRKPKFLTATEAADALADKEPVLGLVVGQDARAYSTNQLNKHEMVLDEVGGIPVLVTY